MNTNTGLESFSNYTDRTPKPPTSKQGKPIFPRSMKGKRKLKKAWKHRHKGFHHLSHPNLEKQTKYNLE